MQLIEYIIQPGDTLTKIAEKFQTTVLSITRLNNIINPNEIIAGQIIKIAAPGFINPSSMQKFYRIQRGDTLTKIAKQFGTTVSELAEINNMTGTECLSIGQIIKIP